jgi:hypothetical protein
MELLVQDLMSKLPNHLRRTEDSKIKSKSKQSTLKMYHKSICLHK